MRQLITALICYAGILLSNPLFAWEWKEPRPLLAGGDTIEQTDQETVAIVAIKPFSGQLQFICTGTRLDAEWVLSVAHGVEGIAVGELGIVEHRNGGADLNTLQLVEATCFVSTDDEGNKQADIALLKTHGALLGCSVKHSEITVTPALNSLIFKLLGWSGIDSSTSIFPSQIELQKIRPNQGDGSASERLRMRPESERWHVGPGNSGGPVFAIDPADGSRRLFGMLVAAETDQCTLVQKELHVLPLANWAPVIEAICAGEIPEGFETRSRPKQEEGRSAWVLESPHSVQPIEVPGEWIFELGPQNQIPARVPIYVCHFLMEAIEGESWSVQVDTFDPLADEAEISVWSTNGMRLTGRAAVNSSKPIRFEGDHCGSWLIRVELNHDVPIEVPIRFRMGIEETTAVR